MLQTFTERFVKFTELQPCVKAKCVSEIEISKLSETLLAGKFWATLPNRLHLTPSDFHLFYYLKHHLDSNHYNYKEVMKMAVTPWLSEQTANFFGEDIQNPVVRYDSCLNKHGNYVIHKINVYRI